MSDKYIAERLGLEIHEIIKREIHPAPNDACEVILRCSCGFDLTTVEHCMTAQSLSTRFTDNHSIPAFSQSVPLLKAEAKRAGLWKPFIKHLTKMTWWKDDSEKQGIHIGIVIKIVEAVTDPALCAQAFEAFLKEREGK